MSRKLISLAKPAIGYRERRAVDKVLKSGMLAQGPEVEAFEQEFSEAVVGGRSCVAVNSGTSGQHLALLAAGIGPGDEVIVPSFTFAATANSVALTGATPVFADISLADYCLDPDSVRSAITSRTVGIMPVHLYGHPAPMAALTQIAKQHSLGVFEDAAQAHLAEVDGKRVGTFGQFAAFSFYPTKNMTSGEGGMVVCEDETFARKVRLLRNQGMEIKYQNEVIGLNNRMTDIHAAIGRVQLRKLPRWTRIRREHADKISAGIIGTEKPIISSEVLHAYHQYTIRVRTDRDAFKQQLRERFGIASDVYYPTPNHLLPSLRDYPSVDDLPNTLQACKEVLSLPIHPKLSGSDVKRIVQAVNLLSREVKA